MMNGMSFADTIFIFVLALIIFGPKKLPEIARQVGKYMNEFKRASNEFRAQIEQEISNLEVEKRQTILPPSPPPEGATSRTLQAAPIESSTMDVAASETAAKDVSANQAAADDEPLLAAGMGNGSNEPNGGGDGVPASENVTSDVTSATSQGSHV
jgi:sec-independent protein translocase protein TatB